MKLTELTSFLADNKAQVQAVEFLAHLLTAQPGLIPPTSNGLNAANFCADFIETFAKRIDLLKKSQS